MKNIIITIIAIFPLLCDSCSKDINKNDIVDIDVIIAFNNELGNDLLDPKSKNHYSQDSIHVYNVVNGKKIERYYSNLDNPRLWSIFYMDSINSYVLGVGIEVETTLLELNKHTTDTITSTIDKSNGNLIVRKVWYNGILKWDVYSIPRFFTITK